MKNPMLPHRGINVDRVERGGGGLDDNAPRVRVVFRYDDDPRVSYIDLGFRLCSTKE